MNSVQNSYKYIDYHNEFELDANGRFRARFCCLDIIWGPHSGPGIIIIGIRSFVCIIIVIVSTC